MESSEELEDFLSEPSEELKDSSSEQRMGPSEELEDFPSFSVDLTGQSSNNKLPDAIKDKMCPWGHSLVLSSASNLLDVWTCNCCGKEYSDLIGYECQQQDLCKFVMCGNCYFNTNSETPIVSVPKGVIYPSGHQINLVTPFTAVTEWQWLERRSCRACGESPWSGLENNPPIYTCDCAFILCDNCYTVQISLAEDNSQIPNDNSVSEKSETEENTEIFIEDKRKSNQDETENEVTEDQNDLESLRGDIFEDESDSFDPHLYMDILDRINSLDDIEDLSYVTYADQIHGGESSNAVLCSTRIEEEVIEKNPQRKGSEERGDTDSEQFGDVEVCSKIMEGDKTMTKRKESKEGDIEVVLKNDENILSSQDNHESEETLIAKEKSDKDIEESLEEIKKLIFQINFEKLNTRAFQRLSDFYF